MTAPAPRRPAAQIEALLAQPEVTEILVNGDRGTYIERAGRLEVVGCLEPEAVLHFVERTITPLGLRLDRCSPIVDARLADGSRLHAVIPPVAVDGLQVCIRRFAVQPFPLTDFGLPAHAIEMVRTAVAARVNVVVSGATSTGKTSFLNSIAGFIPGEERVITIEETAELRLSAAHVVRLEARPANAEGAGSVSTRELVRAALRMRPDRIVVGEVRGAEAFDLVQALHTGHAGSLCTVHANAGVDALERITQLALLADVPLGARSMRQQVATALGLLVHLERGNDGRRGVREILHLGTEPARVLWSAAPPIESNAGG